MWEMLMKDHPDSDGAAPRVKHTRRVFPGRDYNASAWAQMLYNARL